MLVIGVAQPGAADVLRPVDVPDPVLPPGDGLVEIATTAVNRADLLERRGHYPPPPGTSEAIGLECSGTVRP